MNTSRVYIPRDQEDDPEMIAQLAQVERTGVLARAAAPHIREALANCPSDWTSESWHVVTLPHIRPFVIGYLGGRGVKVAYCRGKAGGTIVTVSRIESAEL